MNWALATEDIDHTVASALLRRKANRRPGQDVSHLPSLWSQRCAELRAWQFKTHFAVVLTGLVAKAADERADPRSLKKVAGPTEVGRYSAAKVWKTFYDRAVTEKLDLCGLKAVPHNNQPYMAMKYIDGTTDSTTPATKQAVATLYAWLSELNVLSNAEALDALDAFLLAVPDLAAVRTVALGTTREIKPDEVFDAVTEFINADTENGRRGQAMLAACLHLVHGDDVETPASINDPSRNSLGDATIRKSGKLLGAESKQRIVTAAEVQNTAEELHRREAEASLVYAAYVNGTDGKALAPKWREIAKKTGTVVVVHDDAASLLRDAIVWSALPVSTAIVEFTRTFFLALAHVDVRQATLDEWLVVARGFGIDVAESHQTSEESAEAEDLGYAALATDAVDRQESQTLARRRAPSWVEER